MSNRRSFTVFRRKWVTLDDYGRVWTTFDNFTKSEIGNFWYFLAFIGEKRPILSIFSTVFHGRS